MTTMTAVLTLALPSTTREHARVEITTTGDPTAAAPEFALTTSQDSDDATWEPGTWATSWDANTGTIDALSPLIGEGQSLPLASSNTYRLHIRWTLLDGQRPEEKLAIIHAT